MTRYHRHQQRHTPLIVLTLLSLHTLPAYSQVAPRQDEDCPEFEALPCKHGTCKMGEADYGYHGTLNLPFLNTTNIDFMHCDCPEGYTGVMCENVVATCGNDEHYCFNGATCVNSMGGDGISYGCDCEDGSDHSAFAGSMCEHAATSFCEYGVAVSKHAFCVNGGECKDVIIAGETHPGCTCPTGYSGMHCEILPGDSEDGLSYKYSGGYDKESTRDPPSAVTTKSSESNGNTTEMIAFSFLIAVVVATVVIAAVLITRFARRNKKQSNAQTKVIETPGVALGDGVDTQTTGGLSLDPDGGSMPTQNRVEVKVDNVLDADGDGEFI